MIRAALSTLALTLSISATTAELDPYADPLVDMRREAKMVFSKAPIVAHYVQPTRRSARAVNERNYALAIRFGEMVGNPAHVTTYHVDKESGGRADARNPASTATGISQVVYHTHIAITGERMTKQEHFRKAKDPTRSAAIMAAHIAACRENRPHWTPEQLHRIGYMGGVANCGGSLHRAAQHYASIMGGNGGWLARGEGSTAAPWAAAYIRTGGGA
jgi:hypothetical protein